MKQRAVAEMTAAVGEIDHRDGIGLRAHAIKKEIDEGRRVPRGGAIVPFQQDLMPFPSRERAEVVERCPRIVGSGFKQS